MTTFEMNSQRAKGTKWESRDYDTQEEAKKAAEFFGKFTYNCNWQATQPSQENRPAWAMRNGKPQ